MKFVICGNYGADNKGDEMILDGLIKSIKSIDQQAEITVLSGNPEQTTLLHNVRSFKMFPSGVRSLINSLFTPCGGAYKTVKQCDYFILGGGGLFSDLSFRAYLIWNCQAQKALKMGKKLIMYGQSVGPIQGKYKSRIVKNLFEKSEFIAVRDKASKYELEKLEIKQKIHLMPDLALRETVKTSPGKRSLVAPRYLKNLPKNFDLKKFIKKHKAKVINFHPDDKKLTSRGKINPSVQLINEEYKKAKIVVGMRLHSIIMAVKHEKPFIAFNYSGKVAAFVEELGLKSQLLNIDEFEKLEDLYKQSLENSKEIIKKIQDYKASCEKRFSEIEKLLKSHLKGTV